MSIKSGIRILVVGDGDIGNYLTFSNEYYFDWRKFYLNVCIKKFRQNLSHQELYNRQ